MAQSKTALIKAVRIHTYIADESVAYPAHDKLTPADLIAAGWAPLGYTSKETPLAITTEGGEITTLDAAEEDAVIAVAAATSRVLEVKAHQFDAETLSLAYNGTYDPAAKTFKVPTTSQPLTKRLLTVITNHDGKRIAAGALTAISVGEEPSLSFEALSQIGLRGTVLGDGGFALTWIGIEASTVPAEPVA